MFSVSWKLITIFSFIATKRYAEARCYGVSKKKLAIYLRTHQIFSPLGLKIAKELCFEKLYGFLLYLPNIMSCDRRNNIIN